MKFKRFICLIVASMLLVGCSTNSVKEQEENEIAKYMVGDVFIKDYLDSIIIDLMGMYSPSSNDMYYKSVDSLLGKMAKVTATTFKNYVNMNYNYDTDNNKNRKARVVKAEVGISDWGNNKSNRIIIQLKVDNNGEDKIITFEFILNSFGEIANYEMY